MRIKTDLEKIRMMIELRRRSYTLDIETQNNKDFFKGCESATFEILRKLQDMKYVEDYIDSKQKYMTTQEKNIWRKNNGNKKFNISKNK